ncbi:MAG TPA: plastocyanin/azurin family copper-binding protein, partial [Solirubrobacteraceae bacterium]|nr:plastocyanin/azurin family copper-binding protein [Solirubrobacteraceae bacterium]
YRDDQTITADDGLVFTPDQVQIDVGDTVTWSFDNPNMPHNVAAKSDSPTAWATGDENNYGTNHPDVVHTFAAAGTYTFQCQVHPDMDGTVVVGDGGNPDPTPTPSPTPTPTPTTQPGTTHPTTPPPSGDTDTIKPTVRSVKLKALRRAVRVRFRLSEPATVTVRVKRGRRVVKSKRVQAGAGTHSVTVRSKKLKKGRYTVEILARDASGNRSRLATKRLSVRK